MALGDRKKLLDTTDPDNNRNFVQWGADLEAHNTEDQLTMKVMGAIIESSRVYDQLMTLTLTASGAVLAWFITANESVLRILNYPTFKLGLYLLIASIFFGFCGKWISTQCSVIYEIVQRVYNETIPLIDKYNTYFETAEKDAVEFKQELENRFDSDLAIQNAVRSIPWYGAYTRLFISKKYDRTFMYTAYMPMYRPFFLQPIFAFLQMGCVILFLIVSVYGMQEPPPEAAVKIEISK